MYIQTHGSTARLNLYSFLNYLFVLFNSLSQSDKAVMMSSFKIAERMNIRSRQYVLDIMERKQIKFIQKIVNNKLHPPNEKFKLLPSGRRMNNVSCRTSRYQRSFVPSLILFYNALCCHGSF